MDGKQYEQQIDAYQDKAGQWYYGWDAKLHYLLDKIDDDFQRQQKYCTCDESTVKMDGKDD